MSDVNPDSMRVYEGAFLDQTVVGAKHMDTFQFERTGFFCVDTDSTPEKMVFNLTVELRGV